MVAVGWLLSKKEEREALVGTRGIIELKLREMDVGDGNADDVEDGEWECRGDRYGVGDGNDGAADADEETADADDATGATLDGALATRVSSKGPGEAPHEREV